MDGVYIYLNIYGFISFGKISFLLQVCRGRSNSQGCCWVGLALAVGMWGTFFVHGVLQELATKNQLYHQELKNFPTAVNEVGSDNNLVWRAYCVVLEN